VDTSLPQSPWTRIKEHKIIQWALGYLAAALALTHSEELIARAFDWPEFISRALIVVLALGLPVAITLAWYHGHRASRHVSGAEAGILAVLLLIGSAILWLFVHPQPHEPAVAHSVTERAAAPGTSPAPSAAVPSRLPSTAPLVLPPNSGKPRIAILPFENLSPDPANAFFTDGLHEEILATLANRVPGLEVISRTTMMMYRTAPKPVETIAQELGATHVLEGSVRREGNTVRLTLQLIDARTDQHVWSQDYDRTLKSALTLQSEVANVVAAQLSSRLARGTDPFKPPTGDPQAYDLYLKAKLAFDQTNAGPSTPLELVQNLERLLDAALGRDSSFAAAYVLRARLRATYFVYNYEIDGHALRLAREDLAAAERLAPDDPNVLWLRAQFLVIDQDFAGALAAYDAAYAAGLTDPVEIALASLSLALAGRVNDAIQRAERARALDPRNPRVMRALAGVLLIAGRPAEAVRILDFGATEFPETFRPLRAATQWEFTGSPQALNSWVSATSRREIRSITDVESLNSELAPLRIQHRYAELADVLNRATSKTIRSYLNVGQDHPLAEHKGWTHLLLRDEAAAAQDGQAVLDFVAHCTETKWNRGLLHLLTAEGNLFMGDKVRAVAAADKASRDTPYRSTVWLTPQVAAVYAWAGAQDEASAILEHLSTGIPVMLPPAWVTRDPLFTVPLAGNARYQALSAKLEAQMTATKLE
jgi:TolB-like protein